MAAELLPHGGQGLAGEVVETAIGIPLTNAWGMTETSPVVTTSRLATHHDGLESEARRLLLGSPGPAVPLIEIRIVVDGVEQPRDGQSQGELQAAGATIAGAYFGTDSGADAFTADGWLRTGDVATIDERGISADRRSLQGSGQVRR